MLFFGVSRSARTNDVSFMPRFGYQITSSSSYALNVSYIIEQKERVESMVITGGATRRQTSNLENVSTLIELDEASAHNTVLRNGRLIQCGSEPCINYCLCLRWGRRTLDG